MRRRIALVTGLVVLVTTASALAATPEVIHDVEDVREFQPSRSEGYLVWTQYTQGSTTFVMADGGSAVKVNRPKTDSFGAAIDGTTIAYDEIDVTSDIMFFDADTEQRSEPPGGVNTQNWEEDPALSNDWLMFVRSNFERRRKAYARVILFNLDTSERRTLLDVPRNAYYVVTDQVNGDWATYETCRTPGSGFVDCQVWLYQISTDTTIQVPNPGVQQYAGGVTSDGTVYLVRSGGPDHWECGRNTRIVRVPLGGQARVIGELPDRVDALTSFAFEEPYDSVTFYFERLRCRSGNSGIYAIRNADTA